MRTSRLAAILTGMLLSGACSSSEPVGAIADNGLVKNRDNMVMCARRGEPLARRCSIERVPNSRGLLVIIRHPDGGFRRLLATRHGRGLIAADGAAPARLAIVGNDLVEVAVGDERYRLPASIGKKSR